MEWTRGATCKKEATPSCKGKEVQLEKKVAEGQSDSGRQRSMVVVGLWWMEMVFEGQVSSCAAEEGGRNVQSDKRGRSCVAGQQLRLLNPNGRTTHFFLLHEIGQAA